MSYENIVRHIISKGRDVEVRSGVRCRRVQGLTYSVRPSIFPLITSKQVNFFHIIIETLWYLSGNPSLDILHLYKMKYWDVWENEAGEAVSKYGHWWRSFPSPGGPFDQVRHILEEARRSPMSRRLLVSAWEPEFASTVSLPPCHVMWHLILDSARNTVGLHLHQRSCDVAVGLPYNTACYALLLRIIARILGREHDEFTHSIVDAHIYLGNPEGKYNHIPGLNTQLSRPSLPYPEVVLDASLQNLEDFLALLGKPVEHIASMIRLENYHPHPAIRFEVMP